MEANHYAFDYFIRRSGEGSFEPSTRQEIGDLITARQHFDVKLTMRPMGTKLPETEILFIKKTNGDYKALINKRPIKNIRNFNGNPVINQSELFENIPVIDEDIAPGLLLWRINELINRFMGVAGTGGRRRRSRRHKKMSRRRRRSLGRRY